MAQPRNSWTQDPQERLDYPLEWEDQLEGDVILTSSWAIVAAGNVDEVTPLTTDDDLTLSTMTVVWLLGGTLYETYTVTNHIKTAAGRDFDRSITITIDEK